MNRLRGTAARTAVTAMSRLLRPDEADRAANSPRSHVVDGAARFVHCSLAVVPAVVAAAVLVVGCVIPPSLSDEDRDASVNAAPVILDVRDEAGNPFERPGPRDVIVGQGRLVLTLQDPDVNDTLSVRYYLDYGLPAPTPARIECEAAPGATPTLDRQITCSLVGVCTAPAVGSEHVFEIEVFDRPPIVDDNTRLFRKLDPPGLSSSWWWQVNCVEALR